MDLVVVAALLGGAPTSLLSLVALGCVVAWSRSWRRWSAAVALVGLSVGAAALAGWAWTHGFDAADALQEPSPGPDRVLVAASATWLVATVGLGAVTRGAYRRRPRPGRP